MKWWDANVPDAGGDRQSSKALAALPANALSRDQAEALTGMKHQRVSDLKKSLDKLDLYRQCLLSPQYRRAHLREGDARTLLNKGEVEWSTSVRITLRLSTARRYCEGI